MEQPPEPRIIISGKQLAVVIGVWLRHLPKWVWGEEPGTAKRRAAKQLRDDEPDPRRMVATHIAAELERLKWQVSYKEPAHYKDLTSQPRCQGEQAADRHVQDGGTEG